MKYIGEKIILARESRGFSQEELASALGIAQGTLSKMEQGFHIVSDEVVSALIKILHYPVSFFTTEEKLTFPTVSHYRRLKEVSKRSLLEYEAKMNIVRIQLEKFLKNIELPEINLLSWNTELYGSPKLAAKNLREKWKMPLGAVKDITSWIEGNGIPIMLLDFRDDRVDGLSMLSRNGVPIIFANKNIPADRLRATLAHELGHLVLHMDDKNISKERDIEDEAWLFAGEFLLPIDGLRKTIDQRITLETLAKLKRLWHTSMGFTIMKLKEENLINYNQNRYLWQQMSARGYRKKEPVELDFEKDMPKLFPMIYENHKSHLNYSKSELESFLDMHFDELDNLYSHTTSKMKVVL